MFVYKNNDVDLVSINENEGYFYNKNKELLLTEKNETKKIEAEIAKKVVLNKKNYFKYKVKKGESLEKIAKKFGINISKIKEINNIRNDKILAGQYLFLPNNVKVDVIITNRTQGITKSKSVYIDSIQEINGILTPTIGLNQGIVHGNNGVDISADCGTPVYAAYDGMVIKATRGWNSGYGNYIIIQHDKFETLYGHLQEILVNEGTFVNKGDLIGYVGNTGYVIGKTGCHLHFETRGLKNPLAR
jgi:murein DD-endopeptidase MepM/ murein hydrolase activator NlpD